MLFYILYRFFSIYYYCLFVPDYFAVLMINGYASSNFLHLLLLSLHMLLQLHNKVRQPVIIPSENIL